MKKLALITLMIPLIFSSCKKEEVSNQVNISSNTPPNVKSDTFTVSSGTTKLINLYDLIDDIETIDSNLKLSIEQNLASGTGQLSGISNGIITYSAPNLSFGDKDISTLFKFKAEDEGGLSSIGTIGLTIKYDPSTDPNSSLYGNWKHNKDLEMTLTPNRDFTYRYQTTIHKGKWSVNGNKLTLNSSTFNMTDTYSVSGNELIYQSVKWYK